jgi:hypothetical protein
MVPDSAALVAVRLRSAIGQSDNPFLFGATRGTVHDTGLAFHTVPHDPAATMVAGWCERVYSAFKTVECMVSARNRNLKRLVVLIATNFARAHWLTSNLACANVLPRENVPRWPGIGRGLSIR